MPDPSSAKLGAVTALIGAAPDAALRSLEAALAGADGAAMAEIRTLIRAEQRERGFRGDVFAPLLPLSHARADGVSAARLPAGLLPGLWRLLKSRSPALVAQAAEARANWRVDDPEPPQYDELCAQAAMLLRMEPEAVIERLDPQAAEQAAAMLDLAPMARVAVRRLPEWLGKATDERTVALKLIFRDATSVAADATPRLLEIVMGHLPEPQLILRLVSCLTDRASDRYLASSELASFGLRLLEDVDRRIARVKGFDAQSGAAGARAIGSDITVACAMLSEIDQSIELSKDGPWGPRVTGARKTLAGAVESRLREVESTVAHALPLQNVRIAGRMTRPAPKLAADPDPRAVDRARALMVLLSDARASAAGGGYGALRSQVAEKVTERLNVYADEVLHLLNAGEAPDEERAQAYLEIAAEFIGYAKDDQAAQIVRRRAAVAGERSPSQQDVA